MRNKIIGWYEIISGIIGIFFLGFAIIRDFKFLSIPVYIIALLLLFFVIYSGNRLINKPLIGIKISIFAQLIQTVGFSIPGFIYLFSTTAFLSFYISEKIF